MKKLALYTGILLSGFSANTSNAQTEVDALRYSQSFINGSARFNGMAGAFTALGGDLTSMHQNPAGLALYRRNEISGSLNFFNQSTFTNYNGSSRSNTQSNLNIPQFGFLIRNELKSDYGWVSNYFAFNYNKTDYFHNQVNFAGANPTNSLVTQVIDTYNAGSGTSPKGLDGFIGDPFYQVFLIDTIPGQPNKYFSPFYNGGVLQTKSIQRSGRMAETAFSFGGNYKDKLFLGAAISINSIKFQEKSVYSEKDEKDTIQYLKSFDFKENLSTSGYGFNIKAGFVYKPADWVRIGASIIAPTVYSLSDNYSTYVLAKWDSLGDYAYEAKGNRFSYQLVTPTRANAGVAFIIGKSGLISADYEYLDYTKARLNASTADLSVANDKIVAKYTTAQNIRVGGEIRMDPFAIRAGYGLYSSPYNSAYNTNAFRTYYTGGLGYREDNFFMDLSLLLMGYNELYYLYAPKFVKAADQKFAVTSISLTAGFKF